MKKIHFEIGHVCYRNEEEGLDETESVFCSKNLSDCLKEFAKQGYTQPEYFIDVWEQDNGAGDQPSFPIADISIEEWVLADYRLELAQKERGF